MAILGAFSLDAAFLLTVGSFLLTVELFRLQFELLCLQLELCAYSGKVHLIKGLMGL